ncbi:nitroreductase family protein [Patescibacteria group bacterium]|nr:nitroreductase family protein [Patescibacteria group bacterium]
MNFEDVVKNRKSVRKFQEKPIEKEKIKKILELVNLAPSAGNLQAYKIFVVKDKKKIKLIGANVGGIQRNFDNLSPIIFIFCANPDESALRYEDRGKKLYAVQDATIACSYAQLIAVSLGLGSCWVGSFDEKIIQEILQTDLLPIAILPLGYPAETPPCRPRKSLNQLSKII